MQWCSEGAERADPRAKIGSGGKNGVIRGTRHLTTFGAVKLPSAPGADKLTYATPLKRCVVRL